MGGSEQICTYLLAKRVLCLWQKRGRAPPAPVGQPASGPWQGGGGAVCRMASAKAGRRKAAKTKVLSLPSERDLEDAVEIPPLGPAECGERHTWFSP